MEQNEKKGVNSLIKFLLIGDMLQEVELSDGSKAPLTGPAAKFSRTPTKIRNGAPSIGADNFRVFKSFGLSLEEMKKLKEDGVI